MAAPLSTVLAILMVSAISSPSTIAMSVLPETTVPAGCRDHSGQVIEGLKPGGEWRSESGCTGCHCDDSWTAMCWVQDCWITPCVDSVRKPGVCCPVCPNGNNCKTPSGKIVKQGEYLVEGNTNCSCTANTFTKLGFGNGTGPQAECSISLSADCRFSNGTVAKGVKPGDQFRPDPCSTCFCQKDNLEIMCAMMMCALPFCGHLGHYTPEGECCPRCREGVPGCQLPNGTVVKGLLPGDQYKLGPCSTCHCQTDGQMMCASMACAMPLCGPDGHYTPEGECCPKCREDCEDSHSHCRFWAYNGECDNNPGWMRSNCKKSCLVCDSECVDSDENCEWWSSIGECRANPVWMLTECTKSCKACSPRNPV